MADINRRQLWLLRLSLGLDSTGLGEVCTKSIMVEEGAQDLPHLFELVRLGLMSVAYDGESPDTRVATFKATVEGQEAARG